MKAADKEQLGGWEEKRGRAARQKGIPRTPPLLLDWDSFFLCRKAQLVTG